MRGEPEEGDSPPAVLGLELAGEGQEEEAVGEEVLEALVQEHGGEPAGPVAALGEPGGVAGAPVQEVLGGEGPGWDVVEAPGPRLPWNSSVSRQTPQIWPVKKSRTPF